MLTVAISTVDRAQELARTLESFCQLTEPDGGWQLRVVDNGSADDTPRVLERFKRRLPLQDFHCAEPGKNRALNTLVPYFQGDLVVFTDDDVIPARDWLCAHRRLADQHPDVTVFGGAILPLWESPPPTWMVASIPFDACFGQTGPDWEEGASPPGRIWGANMSVRAQVFAEGFRFDPQRGPHAGNTRYLTGGETSFVHGLHASGKTCYFSREPVVQHVIRADQRSYLSTMRRGFRLGRLKGARHDGLLPARGQAFMHWLLLEARCAVNAARWACAGAETWRARRDWQLNVERGRWYQLAEPRAGSQPDSPPAQGATDRVWPRPLLRIPLTPVMGPEVRAFHSGRRKRIATVTAVKFLGDNRLLASHLNGHRLYLIEFSVEAGTHQILAELPTTWRGAETNTDLLDMNQDGLVAVSNFDERSVTFYRLDGDHLSHERDLPIPDDNSGHCHGVKFTPDGRSICLTCVDETRSVYFIDVASGRLLYRVEHGEWRPKDVCFADESRMVIVYCRGSPTRGAAMPFESKVCLVHYDLHAGLHCFVSEVIMPVCQVDNCVFRDGRVFIANQMDDCLQVLRLDGDTLTFEMKIGGYSFPHGVDVLSEANLLAVTNYGTSDIVISRLDEALAAGVPDQSPLLPINHEFPNPNQAVMPQGSNRRGLPAWGVHPPRRFKESAEPWENPLRRRFPSWVRNLLAAGALL